MKLANSCVLLCPNDKLLELASIVAARILRALIGTKIRTYRSVLPFGLLHQSSRSDRNLTAAVSRRQPSHSFRYSRRGWQPFSAPSYTIYLSKQFSRSVSVFKRWIKYSISAWVNRGKKVARQPFLHWQKRNCLKIFVAISVDFFGRQ